MLWCVLALVGGVPAEEVSRDKELDLLSLCTLTLTAFTLTGELGFFTSSWLLPLFAPFSTMVCFGAGQLPAEEVLLKSWACYHTNINGLYVDRGTNFFYFVLATIAFRQLLVSTMGTIMATNKNTIFNGNDLILL